LSLEEQYAEEKEEEDPIHLQVMEVTNNTVIASPGDSPCMFFVIRGSLDVCIRRGKSRRSNRVSKTVQRKMPTSTFKPKSPRKRKGQGGRSSNVSVTSLSRRLSNSTSMENGTNSQQRQLFTVEPGAFVGLLPLQTGEPWLMTVRAVHPQPTLVIRVTREVSY
jgi:hypothetical protein